MREKIDKFLQSDAGWLFVGSVVVVILSLCLSALGAGCGGGGK